MLPSGLMVRFKQLLSSLRNRYGSTNALAEALAIDPSHLSRAMGARGQPFNIEGCLRLAKVTNEDASMVLRAAGKADIADLIEANYGPPSPPADPLDFELLTAFHAAKNKATRESIVVLVKVMAQQGLILPTPADVVPFENEKVRKVR